VLQSDFSFLMISDATVKPDAFEQTSFISPDVPPSVLYNSAIPPLRLGILASGSGSNVEAIAQAIAQQELNAQIQVLVYNNPQARVTERAIAWEFPRFYTTIESTRAAKHWIRPLSTQCGNIRWIGSLWQVGCGLLPSF
jgi:hypothetical protein